jgi:predicted RecB family nuclease
MDELLQTFDEPALAALKRPWGTKQQKVGARAVTILRNAESLATKSEILLQSPGVPRSANYAMFDCEGLPPQLDELDKIYLWGLQVFGDKPGTYRGATGGFGPDGDRQAWELFLTFADEILGAYGDIPFVHWHHYERVKIDGYISRFGSSDIANRVKTNLVDLLPITRKSTVLPLSSYSLKVVEQYVGFQRQLEEYGGDWAMAKYIEATETEDEATREALMNKILDYNREDLEATWAVLQWLNNKVPNA